MSIPSLPRRRFAISGLHACAALAAAGLSVSASAQAPDTLFHFVTVGDSREEPALVRLNPQESLWIQNTRVWSRMIREMQAVHPQALFFNGDMIYGYSTERAVLDRQYAYWRGMVSHLLETGTYVVPVPGNHEVQVKIPDGKGKEVKTAVLSSENAWRANMGDLAFDPVRWKTVNGTTASAYSPEHAPRIGQDGITTDQRQLSYSFDVGPLHFVIFNTDPVGFDDSAPVQWLREDFAAAQARGAKRFFVFAHKVAYTYVPEKQRRAGRTLRAGFDVRPEVRDAFWDLIESHNAIFFAGHQHVYHAEQPRKTQGGRAWQVIVGSGGSNFAVKPQASDLEKDRMYAWADVQVMRDLTVRIRVQGFDENYGPTRLIETWDVAP